MAQSEAPDALVLIDIQRDYFPGGKMPLYEPERAADMAGLLLERFRATGRPVVHVHHHATRPGSSFLVAGGPGVEPWATVRPRDGEPVVVKHFPNAFRETNLKEILDQCAVRTVALAGMMTHMCVDATARQAQDLGYQVLLAGDGCATRELTFDGTPVPASQVHAAFLAALDGSYGDVLPTRTLLERI